MKVILFELFGIASGCLLAASFLELYSVGNMTNYYKGMGSIYLLAGIAASIPWFMANQHRVKRASTYKSFVNKGTSRHLDWRQFEFLTAEYLRKQGFTVENNTSEGADGGVDARVSRNGKKGIVQCKHYRTTKCSVGVIRELKGVMASEGLSYGIVACTSGFSKEAWEFAKNNGITLLSEKDMINGKKVYA